jgi:hypothetical protein
MDNASLRPNRERLLNEIVKNSYFVVSALQIYFSFIVTIGRIWFNIKTRFGILLNHSQLNACRLSELPEVTKCCFSGINRNPRDILITLEMSTERFYMLQRDRQANTEHVNFVRELTSINERFNKARSKPVTCVLYAEFPRNIETDSHTNLTLE